MKKLDNIEKKNPFKVPDNYFNDLSESLQERVKQPIIIKMKYYWLKLAVAAVISILIISLVVLNIFDYNNKPEIKTQQFVENSFVVNLVDEHIIVNEIIDDTTNIIQENNSFKNTESDEEDVDYVAESIDLESLLAEL